MMVEIGEMPKQAIDEKEWEKKKRLKEQDSSRSLL